MNVTLFVTIFGFFTLIYFVIGWISSKKIKTREDFFLAGRQLGFWSLTFTLVATQIGGGALLGTSAWSYRFGYYGIMYIVGIALGFLLLGLGFASKLRAFNVSTTAELFETKYNSIFLKKMASILSVASLGGILAAQVIGLKSLLGGLGITGNFLPTMVWVFIIIYTMLGGLKAVVFTDVFQVLLILAVFVGIFFYSIGLEPASFFSFNNFMAMQTLFSSKSFISFLPVLINTMLFALVEQDLAQRFFAAKNRKVAISAALMSSVLMILFAVIPVYFGMKAKLAGISIVGTASPLIPILEKMTGGIVLILVVCGLGAAIISTADSLMCAISSNLSQDFDLSFLNRGHLRVSRAITAITGIVAFLIAAFFDDIITVLSGSYELLVSCLFVSVFACFFKKRLNKISSVVSVFAGLLSFVFFKGFSFNLSTIYSVVVSTIGYLIGDLLIKFSLIDKIGRRI